MSRTERHFVVRTTSLKRRSRIQSGRRYGGAFWQIYHANFSTATIHVSCCIIKCVCARVCVRVCVRARVCVYVCVCVQVWRKRMLPGNKNSAKKNQQHRIKHSQLNGTGAVSSPSGDRYGRHYYCQHIGSQVFVNECQLCYC